MSVDREQTRRDELEQAERERDEALKGVGAPEGAVYTQADLDFFADNADDYANRAFKAEAQLAAVPALVEALQTTYDKLCLIVGGLAYDDASAAALFQAIDDLNDVCEIPRAALAAVEQAQERG